jgi:hypothetical protein
MQAAFRSDGRTFALAAVLANIMVGNHLADLRSQPELGFLLMSLFVVLNAENILVLRK